jgi:hypothetical protein
MNTIAENFEQWQSELEELQKSVKKDLQEIQRCKMEVQSMKNNLTDTLGELKELSRGKFIRDDNRIILSAPEIIIGNVDNDGNLHIQLNEDDPQKYSKDDSGNLIYNM